MNLDFLPAPPKDWMWYAYWELPNTVTLSLAGPEHFEETYWSIWFGGKGRSCGRGRRDYESFKANSQLDNVQLQIDLVIAANKILKRIQYKSVADAVAEEREKTKAEVQATLTQLLGPPQLPVDNWEPAEELR